MTRELRLLFKSTLWVENDEIDLSGRASKPQQVAPRASSAEGIGSIKRRKQLIQKPQMTEEQMQQQQQLLQSKIRQEIHQLKSKLAVNKRLKLGKGKSSSPSKSKARDKEGGFFRRQLHVQLQMQNNLSSQDDNGNEDAEEVDDEDDGERSVDSSGSSKKLVVFLAPGIRILPNFFLISMLFAALEAAIGGCYTTQGCGTHDIQEAG